MRIARSASTAPTASTTTDTPQGSLGFEILGGSIGLAFGSAVTYAVMANGPECGSSGHEPDSCAFEQMYRAMLSVLLLVPGFTLGGVAISGASTGGYGGFGWTILGGYGGMFAGLLLSAPFYSGESGKADPHVALAFGAGGLLVGSIAAFRNSAHLPVNISAMPTLDGHGATFMFGGAM